MRQCAPGLRRLQEAEPQMFVRRATEMGNNQKAICRARRATSFATKDIRLCQYYIGPFNLHEIAPNTADNWRFAEPAAYCVLGTLRQGSRDIARLWVLHSSMPGSPLTTAQVLVSGHRTLVSNFKIDEDFLTFFNECEQSFASLWSCLTYQVSIDKAHNDHFDHYYCKCLALFRREISEVKGTANDAPIWFVGMLLCGISVTSVPCCGFTGLLILPGQPTASVDHSSKCFGCIPTNRRATR
jgi:hypothetical protein